MNSLIPISRNNLQPIIKSNIYYVNSLDDVEKITLECNQTILCFDENKPCFYLRERDKRGEYSPVKIYFYEDFATRMQSVEEEKFLKRCKELKFDNLKTEIAHKFFIENEKTQRVWDWLIKAKNVYMEYDSVKQLRYKMKKEFFALDITK